MSQIIRFPVERRRGDVEFKGTTGLAVPEGCICDPIGWWNVGGVREPAVSIRPGCPVHRMPVWDQD